MTVTEVTHIKTTFLGIEKAAAVAGISSRQFRRIIKEEGIPIIQIGRKFFLLTSDIHHLVSVSPILKIRSMPDTGALKIAGSGKKWMPRFAITLPLGPLSSQNRGFIVLSSFGTVRAMIATKCEVAMKTSETVVDLGLYSNECCNAELIFDVGDTFVRCPRCHQLCVWELVEELAPLEEQAA
jgi:hypothetical protein